MDYVTYFETSIASIIGIAISGIAYELINSWSDYWTKRRVSNFLCNKLIKLTNEKDNTRRVVLESQGLDMLQHFSTQGRLNLQSNSLLFQWLLSTLEIGRAIIDIKNELQNLKNENQVKIVYDILDLIKNFFLEIDEYKKEIIFKELKKDFIELEKNLVFKLTAEQKAINNIQIEIRLIYTVMLNKISLPSRGEIN